MNSLDFFNTDFQSIDSEIKRIKLDLEGVSESSVHSYNIAAYLNSDEGMNCLIEIFKSKRKTQDFKVKSLGHIFSLSGTLIRSRYVFIRFVSEAGFEVFLVQFLNGLVGAFSFEDLSACYFKRGYSYNLWLRAFNEIFVKNKEHLGTYLSADHVFFGILMNTEVRPSHYFYEMLCPLANPKVYELVFSSQFHVYWKGTDFLNASRLSSSPVIDVVTEWDTFADDMIKNHSSIIQPSFGSWGGYNSHYSVLDGYILESIGGTKDLCSDNIVVWFSVLSEEKSWLEQNETIARIIDRLLDSGLKFKVLFDGTTRCLSEPYSKVMIPRREVVNIVSKVKFPFDNLDMHLFSSEEKIKLASIADIFLTSNGSDSLYPSRIAGKPGIVHCSPNLKPFAKHFYSDRTIKSDPERSKFVDGDDGLPDDKRSYSICGSYIETLFFDCLEKHVLSRI